MAKDILNIVTNICQENSVELLYLTEFGSILYGTNTPTSDVDYKGIFLQPARDIILGKKIDHIDLSSSNDSSKNTADDYDISLWSLQKWFKLLTLGDTNAIDLLYSMESVHQKKFCSRDFLFNFKENLFSLIDMHSNRSYLGYACDQAQKYGLKGTRMAFLESILDYVSAQKLSPTEKIGCLFDDILEKFHHPTYCFLSIDNSRLNNEIKILNILGKGFMESITCQEALDRLLRSYEKYGNRVKEAKKNKGLDWKAVSHACRCCLQVIELCQTSSLKYPLKDAPFLLKVKTGCLDWKSEVEPKLVETLDLAENLIAKSRPNQNILTNHEQIILKNYNME